MPSFISSNFSFTTFNFSDIKLDPSLNLVEALFNLLAPSSIVLIDVSNVFILPANRSTLSNTFKSSSSNNLDVTTEYILDNSNEVVS